MARSGIALVAALLAASGCGPLTLPNLDIAPAAPAASAPAAVTASSERTTGWPQALTFAGDVSGTMDAVAPIDANAPSECTGRNSRQAGAWASALYGPVGGDVYGMLVTVRPYRGPGVYRAPDVSVQVLRPDGSAVWRSGTGDAATFTVAPGEETGSVEASVTNLTNTSTKIQVSGRWTCRT
jgi:hypothetical protein